MTSLHSLHVHLIVDARSHAGMTLVGGVTGDKEAENESMPRDLQVNALNNVACGRECLNAEGSVSMRKGVSQCGRECLNAEPPVVAINADIK